MGIAQLFFKKENKIGNIELDIIIKESATATAKVTKNPVEKGADISDHIILEPMSFEVEGMVSNVNIGIITALSNLTETFSSTSSKSELIWAALLRLQADRTLFIYTQNLRVYENICIEQLSESQDKDTSNGLYFTAVLAEVNIVGVAASSEREYSEQNISDGMVPGTEGGLKQVSRD